MFSYETSRHLHFHDRAKKIQTTARDCCIKRSLLAICLLVVFFSGCFGEAQDPNLQLNLSTPVVKEKNVSLNGGVSVPVERIQWEWGDGQTDKHHFFPATHDYKNPGTYQITVTVFTSNNTNASKSVAVEIK